MTTDDRTMARFVAQRMKAHNKVNAIPKKWHINKTNPFYASTFQKQLFNLDKNDEEILTHRGRTIAEMGKYDTVGSDSEDDENGNLDGNVLTSIYLLQWSSLNSNFELIYGNLCS